MYRNGKGKWQGHLSWVAWWKNYLCAWLALHLRIVEQEQITEFNHWNNRAHFSLVHDLNLFSLKLNVLNRAHLQFLQYWLPRRSQDQEVINTRSRDVVSISYIMKPILVGAMTSSEVSPVCDFERRVSFYWYCFSRLTLSAEWRFLIRTAWSTTG